MQDGLNDELQVMDEIEQQKDIEMEEAISLEAPLSILSVSDPITVHEATSIQTVINILQEKSIGCLMVVNNNKLTGIFTERDMMLKVAGKGLDWTQEKVSSYMTGDVDTLKMGDPIAYALNKMVIGGFRHVPIIDDDAKPVGLISVKDIINHIGNYFSKDIINLPPQPLRENYSPRDGG